MTIKELYEIARERNIENFEVRFHVGYEFITTELEYVEIEINKEENYIEIG